MRHALLERPRMTRVLCPVSALRLLYPISVKWLLNMRRWKLRLFKAIIL
jgi:hypothetical protein